MVGDTFIDKRKSNPPKNCLWLGFWISFFCCFGFPKGNPTQNKLFVVGFLDFLLEIQNQKPREFWIPFWKSKWSHFCCFGFPKGNPKTQPRKVLLVRFPKGNPKTQPQKVLSCLDVLLEIHYFNQYCIWTTPITTP